MGCGDIGPEAAFEITKNRLKELDLWGVGKIRASKSGCLGFCDSSPVCVIYPEGVWYSYFDLDDVNKIIEDHLINDKIVKSLQV